MRNFKYKIKEIKPQIFLVEFTNQYDMCMTFLRCQEYYESPNPKFRNKPFKIFDFMKWYAEKQGNGVFTYPQDWAGFNFPGKILENTLNTVEYADTWNIYDTTMNNIKWKIYEKLLKSTKDYYVIGAIKNNNNTIRHEISHGLFYLNSEYKKEMTTLVEQLKPKVRNAIFKYLTKMGYTKKVFIDECQAYLSESSSSSQDDKYKRFTIDLDGADKPFIKVFKKYNK